MRTVTQNGAVRLGHEVFQSDELRAYAGAVVTVDVSATRLYAVVETGDQSRLVVPIRRTPN